MKKILVTVIACAAMMLAMTLTAFAGSWEQTNGAWKYKNDDGSYVKGAWQWIDGKCYCFDANGNMYANTTTPDGYLVNENGEWVVDGVVQTQTTTQTQTQASAGTSTEAQRLVWLNRMGLPGDSEETKNAKMHSAVNDYILAGYYDMEKCPITYNAIRTFLLNTDWPNMTDRQKAEAAFKIAARGYNGNTYVRIGSYLGDNSNEWPVIAYHKGWCGLYAMDMAYLCRFMGMDTGVYESNCPGGPVDPYTGSTSHAFVGIKLDGVWYVIDNTRTGDGAKTMSEVMWPMQSQYVKDNFPERQQGNWP